MADFLTDLYAQLMNQGMDLGLQPNNPDIGGHQDQPTYAGPVAGYSGPLRPSDVPSNEAGATIPVYNGSVLSPGTKQARGEYLRETKVGNTNMGHILDMLGALPQHTPKEVEAGLLNKENPGLVQPMTEGHKPTLAERAAYALTQTKQGQPIKDPLLAGFEPDELKILAGIEPKPKAASEPKTPNSNVNKFLTDTYTNAYNSTPGSAEQKKAAALAAAQKAANERNFDVTVNPGMFDGIISNNVKAVERGTGTVGAPAVGTVKGGYRFKGGDPASPSSWVKVVK